jgi:hypothetical protein
MRRQHNINSEDKRIIADITKTLESRMGEWYGDSTALIPNAIELRVYKSSFFLRFQIQTSTDKKFILVKIRRSATTHSLLDAINQTTLHTNSKIEYQSLTNVFDFFINFREGFAMVRPLTYLDHWHAIVMEEFQGDSLYNLLINCKALRGRKKSIKKLLDAGKKTGRWLFLFHNSLNSPTQQNLDGQIKSEVIRYTNSLEVISKGSVSSQKLQNLFTTRLSEINISGPLFSLTHGDMSCNNVLYSAKGDVCIIDIQSKPSSVFTDLGLILIHPDTLKIQVFTLGLFFPKSLLAAYRRAVLDGYYSNGIENGPLINVYCSLMVLDKWARYEDNATRHHGAKKLISNLISPFTRFYFRKKIDSYLHSSSIANQIEYI